MRDIIEVIKQIKKVVPATKQSLLRDLDKHITRCSYKAPEQMHDMWVMLSEIINANLLDEDWKAEMISIFIDKEVAKVS